VSTLSRKEDYEEREDERDDNKKKKKRQKRGGLDRSFDWNAFLLANLENKKTKRGV
jgi:hypothetical protein